MRAGLNMPLNKVAKMDIILRGEGIRKGVKDAS